MSSGTSPSAPAGGIIGTMKIATAGGGSQTVIEVVSGSGNLLGVLCTSAVASGDVQGIDVQITIDGGTPMRTVAINTQLQKTAPDTAEAVYLAFAGIPYSSSLKVEYFIVGGTDVDVDVFYTEV